MQQSGGKFRRETMDFPRLPAVAFELHVQELWTLGRQVVRKGAVAAV